MPEWLRRYVRPREGWLSYFLLFVMLLSLGWAVQRAGWLDQAEFLVPVAPVGVAARRALLGLTSLTRRRDPAHLRRSSAPGSCSGRSAASTTRRCRRPGACWRCAPTPSTSRAPCSTYGYPTELTPYAIGLGLIMWITAFIAAYTIYRHHRVLDAIVLVGRRARSRT